MNTTTIGSIPNNSNWKRIKGQYVAAAAGVALAVSAVAAFGIGATTSSPASPDPQAPVRATVRDNTVPHQYFYIVATEAQRGALIHDGEANVVVAGSDAHRSLISTGATELNALGIPATIVDMTANQSATPGTHRTSDADIVASVLSTELANFTTPAVTPKASDADVTASVISGEMAMYDFSATQPAEQRHALRPTS